MLAANVVATAFFFNTSGEAARVGVAAAEPTMRDSAAIQKLSLRDSGNRECVL